jgi:hypothetical protein
VAAIEQLLQLSIVIKETRLSYYNCLQWINFALKIVVSLVKKAKSKLLKDHCFLSPQFID